MKKALMICAAMVAMVAAYAQDVMTFYDVCWPVLKEMQDYRRGYNEPTYSLAAHSDVVAGHMDVTADVELVGNDSVRISGTVYCRKNKEPLLFAPIFIVDNCVDDVYMLKPNPMHCDVNGNFSFTAERKDGQVFIIETPGYDPVFLHLRCCFACTQDNSRKPSHAELKQ